MNPYNNDCSLNCTLFEMDGKYYRIVGCEYGTGKEVWKATDTYRNTNTNELFVRSRKQLIIEMREKNAKIIE